jgi:hypothetical protein
MEKDTFILIFVVIGTLIGIIVSYFIFVVLFGIAPWIVLPLGALAGAISPFIAA